MTPAKPLRRVGLARALSKLGYCSRARGFRLVRAGRVRVNGSLRTDPESPVHLEKDRIAVDNQFVQASARVYLMMNKPRGVVTTASDERGRETVYAHLDKEWGWVAPVGRLDKASEGLLLLTNDSEWANKVASPEQQLEKTYHVQVGTLGDEELLARMVRGVRSPGGEVLRVQRAKVLRVGEKNSWIEIVLDEGKNRQIRRILGGLGVAVLRLVRVAIGPLVLGKLTTGEVRRLTAEERRALARHLE